MKSPIPQTSKEDLQDLLKKFLHQNGMCLLIYPEGSNTSLLTALAETIHTSQDMLKEKLVQKLQYDYKHRTLPKKLHYIYDDQTIIDDFRRYPELVKFAKIILELFGSSSERRLNLFTLIPSNKNQYNLSCLIINQKGYSDSISIARIYNKYYNIKARNLDSRNQLSLQEAFKSSSHHIDSDELIQTFKTQSMIPEKLQKINEVIKPQETKSTTKIVHIDEIQQPLMNLKRAKSTMPYKQVESAIIKNEPDMVSLGDHLQYKEDTQLINECINGGVQNFDAANYQNSHMMPMSPEQMYYLYYSQNPYYSGKPESYVNYQQSVPIHPLSPNKSANIYKQPGSPIPSYYPNQSYGAPGTNVQPNSPPENSENKRYAGRLKFFDDAKNYGFIIMDADESDIFVHYDDLQKAGISKDAIKSFKNEMYMQIRFTFKVMEYFGKYKKSRKAVELIIIDDGLNNLASLTGLNNINNLNGFQLPQ